MGVNSNFPPTSSYGYFPLVRLQLFQRRTALSAELLLPAIASASATAPRLHRSAPNYCSPYPSASAAACRLRPLQLLSVPDLRPLWLLLADCIRFNCCSSIASASTAAPRLRPLVVQPMPNFLRRVRGSVKYEGRASPV